MTTFRRTLVGGPPGAGGYRRLVPGPGAPHVVRDDLAPAAEATEPLLALTHVSDLHLCDAQSPARVEMLDRWSDPDSPIRDVVGEIGTYRAQEMLTAQVAAAWVQAANSSTEGPLTGRAVDLAVVTGDNTDNGQANELDWYLALLDGGTVAADSGDPRSWDGVGGRDCHDERYWHPDGLVSDLALAEYGFPVVRGLLDAARAPVMSAGLDVPWLAVHGNHDNLLQGTVPGRGRLRGWPVGDRRPVALPPGLSPRELLQLLDGLAACSPDSLEVLGRSSTRSVTPDPARRLTSLEEFVAAHGTSRARPARHGFPADGRSYYAYDLGPVLFVVLDTVNPYGGWQGSLDAGQLAWLDGVLTQADADERYVVLASHHPLGTLVNDIAPPRARPRILGPAMSEVLSRHPCVVLWLNGHTHRTSVEAHGTWWEVTAPSLIDWPQQGRVVEIMRGPRTLTIAVTMLDHAGEAPWAGGLDGVVALAGLSRELAANDWQTRVADLDAHTRAGVPGERNVLLGLPDPWARGQRRPRVEGAGSRRSSVEA